MIPSAIATTTISRDMPIRVSLPGAMRRELQGIATACADMYSDPAAADPLTQRIQEWHALFFAELRYATEEEAVLQRYIALLQQILVDPVTLAPLDRNTFLGSDGHAYGQLSLLVYRLSVPIPYRDRSPMDPTDERPFTLTAHPVARYMTTWLWEHNALLYSESLERTYLQLLPQQAPELNSRRAQRIARRQEALKRVEDLAYGEQVEELEQRFDRARLEAARDFARITGTLDVMEDPLVSVRQETDVVRREQQETLTQLSAAMSPLVERMERFEQGVASLLTVHIEKIDERLSQVHSRRRELEQEIEQLHEKIKTLEELQQTVEARTHALKQAQVETEKKLIALECAIKEKQKSAIQQIVTTAALAGVTAFASWTIAGILQESSFSMSFYPQAGGAGMKITYGF